MIILKRKISITTLSFLLVVIGCMVPVICKAQQKEVGKPYTGWHKGQIDINFIYTGTGESTFIILPDGTSLLIDAGDGGRTGTSYPYMTPRLPDSSHRAGYWIAQYIKKVNPYGNHVDYFLVSHFHSDHVGSADIGAGYTHGRFPNYELSGIAQVAEYINFDVFIDRGFPNYDYPYPITHNKVFDNYRRFIIWKHYNDGLKIEKFKVGSTNQIVLKKHPKKYPNFSILNLVSNGIVWNTKTQKPDTVYKYKYQYMGRNGNTLSTGIRLSYGPFSYYTAGDLSGMVMDSMGQQIDIQKKVAKMCGPVDVAKMNHHGWIGSMTKGTIKYLQARVYVACVWDWQHFQPKVISRMAKETRDGFKPLLFYTWVPDVYEKRYHNKPWMDQIVSDGHVIVKVYDGGKKYKVYLINAKNEKMIVKAVYGPFNSKRNLKY